MEFLTEKPSYDSYRFTYGTGQNYGEVQFINGKIFANGNEMITKAEVLNLINPTIDSYERLTIGIDKIELSGFTDSYKNGTYVATDQKISLLITGTYMFLEGQTSETYVKEINPTSFMVVVRTRTLSPFQELFGIPGFFIQEPTWFLIRMNKHPNLIGPNVDHIQHFINFEHMLGTETSYFGPHVSYVMSPLVKFSS